MSYGAGVPSSSPRGSLLERSGFPDPLSWFALLIVVGAILFGLVSIETTREVLGAAKIAVVGHFDWLFVFVVNAAIAIAVLFAIHPSARLRLGEDEMRPEFSRLSWFAMLFSAGLASGLLYWAAAEPIIHAQSNPFMDAGGRLPNKRGRQIGRYFIGGGGWPGLLS